MLRACGSTPNNLERARKYLRSRYIERRAPSNVLGPLLSRHVRRLHIVGTGHVTTTPSRGGPGPRSKSTCDARAGRRKKLIKKLVTRIEKVPAIKGKTKGKQTQDKKHTADTHTPTQTYIVHARSRTAKSVSPKVRIRNGIIKSGESSRPTPT